MLPVLAVFGIAVGVLVVAQWAGNYLAHRIPELESEPWAIRFHIAAEMLMAVTLILAGVLVLAGAAVGAPLLAVGFGMTLYSIVNSSGYFAQRRAAPPLVMFAVLFALTALSAAVLVAQP